MESYTDFAYIYDKIIGQDYEKWADYIEAIFDKNEIKPKLVLDLGCGTGSITNILATRGYDMIGVDISVDMLNVAREKSIEKGLDVLYLCQDVCEFELYGTVDAIICTLDVLNYVTDKEKLSWVFKLVRNYLNDDGIFIFDMNTPHRLENILGNNTMIYEQDGVVYTWDNRYENSISTQYLTFFCETENGLYERFDETHIQRAYKTEELTEELSKNGLKIDAIYNVLTFEKPNDLCEKQVFVSKCLG